MISAIVFWMLGNLGSDVVDTGRCALPERIPVPERAVLLLLSLALVLACGALIMSVGAYGLSNLGVDEISVASPPSSSIVVAGETLVVQAVATGKGLVRSELLVDGAVVDSLPSPRVTGLTDWSITHSWVAQLPGQHRITIRVRDLTGSALDSRSLVIAVAPPGRIAFASNRGGSYQIYLMPIGGGEPNGVAGGPEEKRQPSCNEAGRLLYSATRPTGGGDIGLVELETGQSMDLTASLGRDFSPRWAPDGESIAFVSDRYGLSQLFVMDPDGGGQFQLTRGDSPAEQPGWSPDGSFVVFASQSEGDWEIFRISVGDGDILKLTDSPGLDSYPAWSPNGDSIAFTSDREGTHQVYVMNTDGSEQRRITSFPSGAEQPQWSPDGEWIVCVAYTGRGTGLDAREIYLVRQDGSDQMRLTDNPYDDTEPVWCE
jgi:Tol biopolymer transport system component